MQLTLGACVKCQSRHCEAIKQNLELCQLTENICHPTTQCHTSKTASWDLTCWSSGKTGQPHEEELEHSIIPQTEINSEWIKDLSVRPDTIKLLKETIGRTLCDTNQSKIFFDPLKHNENKNKNK